MSSIPARGCIGIGALSGLVAGMIIGGFAIGLPLALNGYDPLSCAFGGVLGGAACGAFLGGVAPCVVGVVARVREHLNKPPICTEAETFHSTL